MPDPPTMRGASTPEREGASPATGAQEVFSTYIDPKDEAGGRPWHPHQVDLAAYAGQTVTLIFETGTSPAGDERYDWAGWGEPRLLTP
jgi:hypothetical protein